jgi:hypothetical protein
MMISKGLIAFVLGSAFVSSAIVYNGIANRHHQVEASSNPSTEQQPAIPKPHAGNPLTPAADADQANNPNDPNAQQSADGSTDPIAQQNQDGKQTVSVDPNQNAAKGSNEQPAAGDSDQGAQEALVRHQQVAAYTASLVRVRKAAVLRALRVVPGAPVATTAYLAPAIIASPALIVPAGTLLTLRLAEPLGSSISQPDQTFSATLDRDIDISGQTAIPAGALLSGKVVAAKPAGALAGEAKLQLQVTSINVNHEEYNISAAIRSFGPTIHGRNKMSRFMKGLARRAEGEEQEVVLAEQTAFSFILTRPLQIQ